MKIGLGVIGRLLPYFQMLVYQPTLRRHGQGGYAVEWKKMLCRPCVR